MDDFFLARDDIPDDLHFVARHKTRNHLLKPLFGSPAFPAGFRRALRSAALSREVEAGGFAVPALWARAVFGERLNSMVDPARLENYAPGYMLYRGQVQPLKWFFVGGGDWDRTGTAVKAARAGAEIEVVFTYRERFRDAPLFEAYVKRAEAGQAYKHRRTYLDSREKVEAFFQCFLDLLMSIERDGYRGEEAGDRPVGVAIGRSGELLHHRFGHHRIAIARALKIQRVPAGVTFVHQEWLRRVMAGSDKPLEIAVADAIQSAGTLKRD